MHENYNCDTYTCPLLALSQVMCLAPAFCPRSGLGGWEEQAESLCGSAVILKLLSIAKVIEGRSQTLSTPVVE